MLWVFLTPVEGCNRLFWRSDQVFLTDLLKIPIKFMFNFCDCNFKDQPSCLLPPHCPSQQPCTAHHRTGTVEQPNRETQVTVLTRKPAKFWSHCMKEDIIPLSSLPSSWRTECKAENSLWCKAPGFDCLTLESKFARQDTSLICYLKVNLQDLFEYKPGGTIGWAPAVGKLQDPSDNILGHHWKVQYYLQWMIL